MRGLLATGSGRVICLTDPRPELIEIVDIAQHLSYLNRWVGALSTGVSVAVHSVLVSRMFGNPAEAIAALLHDAPEAYVGDVSAPLKELLPEFQAIEDGWADAIVARYGYDWRKLGDRLKRADRDVLMAEAEQHGSSVHVGVITDNLGGTYCSGEGIIVPKKSPRQAERMFLNEWRALRHAIGEAA